MIKWIFTAVIIWSIPFFANANLFHDSNLNWKTIETKYYYLHYHDEEEAIVRNFIPKANLIHKQVTGFLSWEPKEKTHVVFTDEFEIPNSVPKGSYWLVVSVENIVEKEIKGKEILTGRIIEIK